MASKLVQEASGACDFQPHPENSLHAIVILFGLITVYDNGQITSSLLVVQQLGDDAIRVEGPEVDCIVHGSRYDD